MDVTIIIGTYGDEAVWGVWAQTAVESARQQSVQSEILHVHAPTLAQARNVGASEAKGKWLVFLDADDTLDEKYVENMLSAAEPKTLMQPATLGVVDGREDPFPVVIEPAASLLDRNHMVIGTMLERDLFIDAGGFREWSMYEDWDLWLRCWINGATWKPVPGAIYRVNVRTDGRNNQSRDAQVAVYNQIRNELMPLARERGLR